MTRWLAVCVLWLIDWLIYLFIIDGLICLFIYYLCIYCYLFIHLLKVPRLSSLDYREVRNRCFWHIVVDKINIL